MQCHLRDEEASAPPVIAEVVRARPALGVSVGCRVLRGGSARGRIDQMTAGGRLTSLARTRIRYTGEPFQYATTALRAHRDLPNLPDAHGEQAVLESGVMEHLGRGDQGYSAHPLGIAGVRLTPQRTVVALDSDTWQLPGQKSPLSRYVVESLLPCAEPGIQVHGIRRLRVAPTPRDHSPDLHLKLVDTNSSLVFRAVRGTCWRKLLTEQRRVLEERGFVPLWDGSGPSPYELDDERRYPSAAPERRARAWLGSGILRRIALLKNTSAAYSVTSWINLERAGLTFELETTSDASADHHDVLLDHLTDAVWGLALRVTRLDCTCGRRPTVPPEGQCTYDLESRGNAAGTLQLRFVRRGRDHDDLREMLEEVDASPWWLDRVLPRHPDQPDRAGIRMGEPR
jgi:hypothetical protein